MKPVIDPRRWSIAARLTLFISLAMGAILLAVAWLMDDQLERQLHEKDEIELAHAIKTQQDIVRLMQAAPSQDAWSRVWMDHLQPSVDVSVRILDPGGRLVSQSPDMSVPVEAFSKPAGAKRYFRWTPTHGEEGRFLLTVATVQVADKGTWTIQAAEDLSERHELLERFHARLQIVMLGAGLIALLMGALLVRRGLSPLRALSAQLDGISVDRLDIRIGSRAWPSDLQDLANNFDAMMIRLQAAFEQLSQFSSDLAHEFRSPITNLVAAASVMLARDRSISEYQETLAIVVSEGERLSRMVSSMLFLARAENAQQAMTLEPVDLEDEFARIVDAFEAVADERGITLEAKGRGTVMADAVLLRRALTNLLSNALAHTSPGGRVRLEVETDDKGVDITVRDTGCGISPEHQRRIFDRFYRVDPARSSAESTGLGLAVVKSIAELHGATMAIESTVGAGSSFTMHFRRA